MSSGPNHDPQHPAAHNEPHAKDSIHKLVGLCMVALVALVAFVMYAPPGTLDALFEALRLGPGP